MLTSLALLGLAGALPSRAAEIGISDYSLAPDGANLTTTFQNTNVNTANGGSVLPASGTPVVYVISTFTFGTASDAHLQWQFSVNETSALRLGVEIQDTGLVQFLGTGDTTRTNFNFAQDMAGQTVTLLAKLSYNANNNVTYGKTGTSDDTILNVWINPTELDVEGSPNSLTAGDMSTIWNSAGFNWFRQTIQNQNTPGTAGTSSITNTKILTGANATFANALLAAGVTPPSTVVDAAASTVSASPLAVPANGTSTSTVTVTLRNASSVPLAGKPVTLSGSPGNATIEPSGAGTDTTDGAGQAIFTVRSSTVGTEVFSATGDSIPITQNASVSFDSPFTDAGSSTVTAAPLTVPADGTSQSIITVTLLNSTGLPLPGKLVSLANTAGPPGSPNIQPAAAGTDTTNANGVATFLVSSTAAGTEEFTATCDTDSVTLTADAVSVDFVTPDAPALLAYDGFDYPLGVLTGNNGGTGFSAGWTSPEASFICQVYDQSGGTLVTWDNVVSGVTMSSPPRYIASVYNATNPGSTAARVLATNAGALAGADNVLWMGVVFHYEDTNSSAGLNIGLSSGGSVIDRGRQFNTAGIDFIGVTNWAQASGTWNNRINATIVDNHVLGTGYSGPHAQTLGTQALPTTEDLLVVLKFTFGASDRVEAAFFKESDSLSEAAFYGNPSYVSATYAAGIDEAALNTLSYTQQRGFNALDEIRIGSTFANTFGGGTADPDYDAWAGNYPGLGAAGADDDGDGLTNDAERIFGLNPQNPSSVSPFKTPFDAAAGTFSYTRRTRSLTGLTYKVRYSTDLEQWFVDSAGTDSQLPGTPVSDVEIVGVTVDPALLTEPKLFIQVSAEDLGPPPPAPELGSLWGSGSSITLNFTEAMNETSATNTANYTVQLDGGGTVAVTGASLSGDGKTVTLTLGSALGIDSAYNVIMSNLAGSSGQPLGGSSTAQFRTWDDDPTGVKVFILAGQSNMVGYGKTEDGGNPLWTEGGTEPKEIPGGLGCLRYLAVNDASFPEYNYASLLVDPGQPATSAWKTRSDVKVWWEDGSDGILGGPIRKGDLGPPFQGANGGWFGPEYAFGQVLGDYYASNDVLIIKTAWGGHSLAGDFRPPSAVAKRGGVVGATYVASFANIRQVLGNLDTEFPAWAGKGYQIVGFGWHQGYNDRVTAAYGAEYKDNLPDLISDVRAEFGKPGLPFVIATTGMGGVGPAEPPPYTGYTTVEKAQLWVAGVTQPANVLSDDTRPYWRDKAIAPSTLGHHWNHSAESYFLIGKKMGENMVTLLSQ